MRGGCAGGSVGGGDPSRRPLRGAERRAAVDCADRELTKSLLIFLGIMWYNVRVQLKGGECRLDVER